MSLQVPLWLSFRVFIHDFYCIWQVVNEKVKRNSGYSSAELHAKYYSVWSLNTNNYFLNELAPIGHRFHQSSSLSFLLLFQIVTVYPFSTSIIPSQLMTRQLDQEKRSEVWLQCSSIPAQKPARPSFSWFFTLLLNWYRVHEVSLFFFLGTGKTHLPIKDHK